MTPSLVVLILKVAVVAVTVLLALSILAVSTGHRKLHGRLNTVFFVLVVAAVLGLEIVVRLLWPSVSAEFFDPNGPYRQPLLIHLCFSVPAAIVLPFMLFTGRGARRAHRLMSWAFLLLWSGTFYTGIFMLPTTSEGEWHQGHSTAQNVRATEQVAK